MKSHKIALLASIFILPMQALSAAGVNHEEVVQSGTMKATIGLPAQKVIPDKTVKPLGGGKLGVVTTGNKVAAPKHQSQLKRIELLSSQQLYLTNGQSIVRVKSTGLSVIGMSGNIKSTHNHASLFEDSNRNIWINSNGTKTKLGIFSRIQIMTTTLKPVRDGVGKFIAPKSSATVSAAVNANASSQPANNSTAGPKLEKFTRGDTLQHDLNGGQTNSDRSGIEVVKPEAPEYESVEIQPDYREFSLFNVTSDSVVATATVVVDDNHHRLTLVWGDGTFEYVTLWGLGSTITSKNRTDDPTKFKFQHIYKAPFDQSNRTVKILALDSNSKGVSASSTQFNLNPRYTFILYPVQLEINEHLDSISETHSELYVYMKMMHNNQLIVGREWNESIKTSPSAGEGMLYPVHYSLGEDSRVHLEMSYQDAPLQVQFIIKEKDNWVKSIWDVVTNIPVSFDTSNQSTYIPDVHPKDFTGSKEYRANYTVSDDGSVTVVMSMELNVIVPSNDEDEPRFNRSLAR